VKVEKYASILNANLPFSKPMSHEDIGKVQQVLKFKHEVWKLTNVCLKQLEEKKRGLQEHLIGLRFSMEDRKSTCVEAKAKITAIEVAF
jgi:hypothetical protein